ncbi:uncharacterized protein LOC127805497 [Diospyros lotus]|uniref:uncharacterized protein LOC127805497 n=1 Tax=Diospyros lotus TaxID=55363 RepID=UPI00225720F9|nr:uncharacterized protein LOC127805497 [Diospyros lotus]
MAKGDDAVSRKKNKLTRKKNRQKDSSSSLSNRVAAIVAAKKRRQTGKRRLCQGMCFSLPTPEDPFNESHGKMDSKIRETKKVVPPKVERRVAFSGNGVASRIETKSEQRENRVIKLKNLDNEHRVSLPSIDNMELKNVLKPEKVRIQLRQTGGDCAKDEQALNLSDCPTKYLILCLNAIQDASRHDGFFITEEDKPLFADSWGIEFWKFFYSAGNNIMEISGICSTIEQIAWIAATAADSIARKEKEGLSVITPFLLFLVPSQEKAIKVRSVCKPLKPLGIHTVSLHLGTSLDHQIRGLKSCEPEFLVSTPERLLELVSLKAIDLSGVSLLVVDGLETHVKVGHLDMVKSIRRSLAASTRTVVFNDGLSNANAAAAAASLGD